MPQGWFHWNEAEPELSGRGWIPVGNSPADVHHRKALDQARHLEDDGTYELCGPKIGKNPERQSEIVLLVHGHQFKEQPPRDFDGIRDWLEETPVEGIVWWHSDGRMVNIKHRDFGIQWPSPDTPAKTAPRLT